MRIAFAQGPPAPPALSRSATSAATALLSLSPSASPATSAPFASSSHLSPSKKYYNFIIICFILNHSSKFPGNGKNVVLLFFYFG
jgi:hypothetical protein